MREEPPREQSVSLNYPAPPEGANYESLLEEGWEDAYSFYAGRDNKDAQAEIDKLRKSGEWDVTVVRSKDPQERRLGVAYVVKKKKN